MSLFKVKEAEASLGEFAKAILFNTGKSTFKSGVAEKLDGIVDVMNKYPNDADFGRIVRWWINSVNEI